MPKSTPTSSKTAATKTKAAPAKTKAAPSKTSSEAVSAAPKPVVVKDAAVVAAPMMRKKELIDIVTERSGIKKRDAKPVVEAMLAVLGQAIAEGRELNLQPLGKVKVNRRKDVQGGKVMITKIRQSDGKPPVLSPVPEAAE